MILKDPLYGFISMEDPFKSLIETEQFQRLRNIKQLGLSNLIYPSANHSRFEHSIGAFNLASKIAENIRIPHKKEFMAAALLHDIGHYPFSHAIEKTIRLYSGSNHEEQSLKIIHESPIAEIIKKSGLDMDTICDLIAGKGKSGKLIAGQIDIDRLDYLKRDSYYTGVAYGVIEADIIIKSLTIKNKNYLFEEKYLPALESILIARYLMYSMVYMHRKTLIANGMLRSALAEIIKGGEISADQLIKFDDIDFISALRASKTPARDLIGRISSRKLYKEAIIFRKNDLDADKTVKNREIARIEKALAEELKIKNYEILINILNPPKSEESEILINPVNKNLEKISPIVQALKSAEWNHWFIGVYCPEKYLDKIRKAKNLIKKYLLL